MNTSVFERFESDVRSYCRSFPTIFERASECCLYDTSGSAYLDFFCGAGALNYGHNPPCIKHSLLEYLARDGVVHSLDMYTQAKADFLRTFVGTILERRGLSYKVQFPGPTGTNAVEAALKLARKVTGRSTVMAFTNAFHGMTLGSLTVTANLRKRAAAGLPLANCTRVPFEGFFGSNVDTLEYIRLLLEQPGSGVELPAAVIVETLQAEGGLHCASGPWLKGLAALCRSHRILLIVDDVQVGCGRTGPFFSFEFADISPDIVCLSKSISGFGLPMALTLIKPEIDLWDPGEHNGTFRGNNLAFVGAKAALDAYWDGPELSTKVLRQGELLRAGLTCLQQSFPELLSEVRGKGLLQGIAFQVPAMAKEVARKAFDRKLLVETAGPESSVVKLMPPLVISDAALVEGLSRLEQALKEVCGSNGRAELRNAVNNQSVAQPELAD